MPQPPSGIKSNLQRTCRLYQSSKVSTRAGRLRRTLPVDLRINIIAGSRATRALLGTRELTLPPVIQTFPSPGATLSGADYRVSHISPFNFPVKWHTCYQTKPVLNEPSTLNDMLWSTGPWNQRELAPSWTSDLDRSLFILSCLIKRLLLPSFPSRERRL